MPRYTAPCLVLCVTGLFLAACNATAPGGPLVSTDVPQANDTGSDVVATMDVGQPDAGTLDTGEPDVGVPDVGEPDTAMTIINPPPGFTPGAHPSLVTIPSQGGPLLDHVQLVVITFADDPFRSTAEAMGRYIVGSPWLAEVGAEYGVSNGTFLAAVELPQNALDTMSDGQVQTLISQGLAEGTIPTPPGGDFSEVLYMVFFPSHTTITLPAQGGTTETSCTDFGGYHDESADGINSFSYAVIVSCDYPSPPTPTQEEEIAVSHELFEAATDPHPNTAPAYELSVSPPTAWLLIGGELGDLCALPAVYITEGGFTLQRVWSNTAAASGFEDPCMPIVSPPYYYSVNAADGDLMEGTAGGEVTFNLQAWSTGPVPAWRLEAMAEGDFMPTTSFGQSTINNGGSTTLTVQIPADAPSGSYALVYVYSAESETDYRLTPLVVLAD